MHITLFAPRSLCYWYEVKGLIFHKKAEQAKIKSAPNNFEIIALLQSLIEVNSALHLVADL